MPSLSLLLVTFGVIAVGMPALLGLAGWPQPRMLEFSGLILAALLTSTLAVQQFTAKDWATVPPSFVIDFTALLLLGPQAMLIVAAAGAIMQWLIDPQRVHWSRHGLSVATVLAAAQAASLVHTAVGGTIGTFIWPQQAVPIALAVIAYCVVKSASAEIIAPLITRQPINRSWPANLLRGVPGYFIGASLA